MRKLMIIVNMCIRKALYDPFSFLIFLFPWEIHFKILVLTAKDFISWINKHQFYRQPHTVCVHVYILENYHIKKINLCYLSCWSCHTRKYIFFYTNKLKNSNSEQQTLVIHKRVCCHVFILSQNRCNRKFQNN